MGYEEPEENLEDGEENLEGGDTELLEEESKKKRKRVKRNLRQSGFVKKVFPQNGRKLLGIHKAKGFILRKKSNF
jgi:hypothetical protein